jgi:hypothetical protein
MAEHLSTVSPGGDQGTPTGNGAFYTTLSSWEAAQQTDLVTPGDTAVVECYAGDYGEGATGGLNNAVTIGGWTSSDTNSITVRAAAGHECTGPVDSGFYLHNSVGSLATIYINDLGVFVERIGVKSRTDTPTASCITYGSGGGGGTGAVTGCTIEANITGTGVGNAALYGSFTATAFINCLVYSATSGWTGMYTTGQVYGCTLIGTNFTGIGIQEHGTTCDIRDNVIYGFTAGDLDFSTGGYAAASSNVATGDSTGVSITNGIGGVVEADFVDFANRDYTPATGNALDSDINPGVTLPELTVDITGATRNDPPEMGAYEIQAAALTFSLSPDSGPLPAGLSVNATTGNIEGTPTESGTFPNIIIRGST